MRKDRWMVAAATLAGGLALSTGVAGAQVGQCDASCAPQQLQVGLPATGTSGTGGGGGDVAAGGEERGGASQRSGALAVGANRAPSGTLPITGGDVAGLALLGGAAVVAGTVLTRRARATV